MWSKIARLVLRNRIVFLIVIFCFTLFFGWQTTKLRLDYHYANMLSEKNQVYIDNLEFKKTFGEEANAISVGINDVNFFDIEHYKLIKDLCEDLIEHENVTNVLTAYQALNLRQVTIEDEQGIRREFELYNLFPENIETQEQLDSLKKEFFNLPFYKGLLYGKHPNIFLLSIGLNRAILDEPERIPTVQGIEKTLLQFSEDTGIELYISGHPFIRTKMMVLIKSEIKIFIVLAALIAVTILFLFFRSFKVVLISILLVGQGVIWTMGTMALLGFKITVLSAMIPPLLIIIGMPNAVYLLNKYHSETKRHSNKFWALHRTIHRTGNAVFLSNLTTAVGFATFMIANSTILKEFGAVASLGIMFTFVLAIIIVPSLVSLWKVPSEKYTKHLENFYVKKILSKIYNITIHHRKKLFASIGVALIIAVFGISLIQQTGFIMDDVPSSAKMYQDLKKLEDSFNGVSPLEIMIRSKDSIAGHDFIAEIQKLDSLQTELLVYDELSRSMSIADPVKFLNQAYSKGNIDKYCIPDNPRTFETIFKRLPQNFDFSNASVKSFIDSTKTVTRLSLNIKDVGTKRMKVLIPEIDSLVKKYFPQEKYRTLLSGSTILYFTGTTFLTKNLFISLALAFVIIGLLLFWMFRSFKMMVLALIPNIIPMLITAGIMGLVGIPLKPSTILVYGVAFGISVDGTIHFLNRYRHELYSNNWNIGEAVKTSIFEIGVSMTYTYSILFFGFIVFSISEFGGTKALGMLVSLELLIAMLSNLIVLPALLLSLEKFYGRKVVVAPPIPIIEEDVKCDTSEDRYEDMKDSSNN